VRTEDSEVAGTIREILSSEDGQDIAEYAVLLALILILVIGAVRLLGENANGTLSRVADALQQQLSEGDSD
jgi:Flp pilus assembly pilin Flp